MSKPESVPATSGDRTPSKKSVASSRKRATPTAGKRVAKLPTPKRRDGKDVEAAPVDTAELRRRWKYAARTVGQIVTRSETHDPRVWERGVYQLWLWLVVELLVIRRDDIGIGELATISKMLCEQRKLSLDELKQLAKESGHDADETASTKLPPQFGDLVRQIYGANLQDDARENPEPDVDTKKQASQTTPGTA